MVAALNGHLGSFFCGRVWCPVTTDAAGGLFPAFFWFQDDGTALGTGESVPDWHPTLYHLTSISLNDISVGVPSSDVKFPLRIPVELDGRLRTLAADSGISLNSLIIKLLGGTANEEVEAANKRFEKSVVAITVKSDGISGTNHEGHAVESGLVEKETEGDKGSDQSNPGSDPVPEGVPESHSCPYCALPLTFNKATGRWNCWDCSKGFLGEVLRKMGL